LSTHIVDDVADLCPNMAVLANGKIVSQGTPKKLIEQLQGRIWKKTIDKSELAQYQQNYKVISNHLCSGKVVLRVELATQPSGFDEAIANLEDVYFLAINPGV
jgi:ABC-type multidrug transport system ATPase subunit